MYESLIGIEQFVLDDARQMLLYDEIICRALNIAIWQLLVGIYILNAVWLWLKNPSEGKNWDTGEIACFAFFRTMLCSALLFIPRVFNALPDWSLSFQPENERKTFPTISGWIEDGYVQLAQFGFIAIFCLVCFFETGSPSDKSTGKRIRTIVPVTLFLYIMAVLGMFMLYAVSSIEVQYWYHLGKGLLLVVYLLLSLPYILFALIVTALANVLYAIPAYYINLGTAALKEPGFYLYGLVMLLVTLYLLSYFNGDVDESSALIVNESTNKP